jgi:DNA polymerase III sliding clamp (beta) subunit (PCNA family)
VSSEVLEGTEAPGGVNYGDFSFRVKRWVLAGLADAAAAALLANASDVHPSLACFRVRVGEGFLELSATDTERTVLAVSGAVDAKDSPEGIAREVFVPAKKLQAILREAPDTEVTLAVKKNQARLTAGGGTWMLTLPDSSDYPELIEIGGLEFTDFQREKFLTALRAVRHVVSRDSGRPTLTQAEVRADPDDPERTVVTASDGSRFARARVDGFPPPAEPLCIPSRALDDLIKLLAAGQSDTAGAALTENAMVFKSGSVVFSVLRRSTPFPDVDKLLLKPALENDQELSVSKEELAAAVRRVRINADGETSAIVLEAEANTLTVVSRDKNGNSATEDIPAAWDLGNGGTRRVLCVNHVFLAEMLAVHPDKSVKFKLGKDIGKRRSQVLLQGDGITQILSQMIPSLVGY